MQNIINIIINMYETIFASMGIVTIKSAIVATTTLHLLFTGDIFLDRHIDELSQKNNSYAYPFTGLKTLEREKYDAWIGNLECPVTDKQSTKKQKETELRFSCKKEYLSELKKYFDIVSLANNHTDNMNGEIGFLETQKHLKDADIKYFGHFDNSKTNEICKVIEIENKDKIKIPIAFCGFNGVFKLPTDSQLNIVKEFSKKHITIILSHQGEEYKFTNNKYQQIIYRKMIDNGADIVIGSHPHVVQNYEIYKGKYIYYSLGNFIFDQSWSKTREHIVVDTTIDVKNYDVKSPNKPDFTIKFKIIPTYTNLDFITKKR